MRNKKKNSKLKKHMFIVRKLKLNSFRAEQKRIDDEKAKFLEKVTKGAILKLSGITKSISFEEVKKHFNEISEVAYVAFKTGDTDVRIKKFIFDMKKKNYYLSIFR